MAYEKSRIGQSVGHGKRHVPVQAPEPSWKFGPFAAQERPHRIGRGEHAQRVERIIPSGGMQPLPMRAPLFRALDIQLAGWYPDHREDQ